MNDIMKEKEITVLNIGFTASIWSNIKLFSILIGGFYLNHQYIDGNNFLDTIFTVFLVSLIFSHKSKYIHKFKTNEEAINFLKENK